MILKIPSEHGIPLALREGEQIMVRVFSGVNVCTFTASVGQIFLHPSFYFHSSFPQTIQGTTLRKAMRVRVHIPGQIVETGSASATPRSVLLSNLSVDGALVESEQELHSAVGSIVNILFTLVTHSGDHESRVNTKGAIRNVNVQKAITADQCDRYTYGVEFVQLDQTHQIMLENLTYEALISDRQKIV